MSNDPNPPLPASIGALVQDSAQRFATVEALVDGPVRLTFADLGAKVREATAAAMASGIEPGDRVAIWAPNSVEWVVAALGLVSAGASLVPLNTRYKGEEAGWVIARSSARLIVVADGFLGADYSGMLASSGIEFPALATTVTLSASPRRRHHWLRRLAGGRELGFHCRGRRADCEHRTRRRQRRLLHVRHYRAAQGRGGQPPPDDAGLPDLGRRRGADRR